jgi:hypothetical protein
VEGRRKRYFGPWAFLLITVGLASAVIVLTDIQWFRPFGHGRAADILQRHTNLVVLLQVPILAAFCTGLFRRERLNYAEHLVLAAYTSGFRALFLALIETPLFALLEVNTADPKLALGYFGVWFGYFAFAASQFYSGKKALSAAKGFAVAVLSQASTIGIVMACLYVMSRVTGDS